MTRVAVLSLHTSPLDLPGQGDAGGMNVYVRELVSGLAQAGVDATVFVRRRAPVPEVVEVEPGFRVVHISAGPTELAKESLPETTDEFADGVQRWLEVSPVDVLHANYWLSGVAGHRLKHELDLPLVCTFHTLGRVKSETGDPEPRSRVTAEAQVIGCADVITTNSVTEVQQLKRLYGADPARVDVVAPGVDSAIFSVGSQHGARAALGLGAEPASIPSGVTGYGAAPAPGAGPVLLFVGRIQPLKGLDVAVETLAELQHHHGDARLLAVGGASGADGEAELRRITDMVRAHGLQDRFSLIEPQPHHLLSTYYRAADVCLVPSRSESFGLVALEAAACGVPVVAADVGGLRTVVDHYRTGIRIAGRQPSQYAAAVRSLLDDPELAQSMGRRGAEMAQRYSWTATASRLKRIFEDLKARQLVDCTA